MTSQLLSPEPTVFISSLSAQLDQGTRARLDVSHRGGLPASLAVVFFHQTNFAFRITAANLLFTRSAICAGRARRACCSSTFQAAGFCTLSAEPGSMGRFSETTRSQEPKGSSFSYRVRRDREHAFGVFRLCQLSPTWGRSMDSQHSQ